MGIRPHSAVRRTDGRDFHRHNGRIDGSEGSGGSPRIRGPLRPDGVPVEKRTFEVVMRSGPRRP